MARKRKPQDAAAKDGTPFVTYVGPHEAVCYMGVSFTRGKPVAVTDDDLPRYASRSFFEVTRGDLQQG